MVDKTLSSIVGGSGNLIFPSSAPLATSDIYIKTAFGSRETSDAAAFWTAIDLSHTPLGWESVSLSAAANTTEQTIVDTTGVGVLTHVMAPVLSGSGTMTIRVTADGEVTTFLSETIGATARFLAGDFKGWASTITAAEAIGIGSQKDSGYDVSSVVTTMTTPTQAVTDSRIGIKFESTLKVTIQGSVNITGTAEQLKAAACYTLSIPKGL